MAHALRCIGISDKKVEAVKFIPKSAVDFRITPAELRPARLRNSLRRGAKGDGAMCGDPGDDAAFGALAGKTALLDWRFMEQETVTFATITSNPAANNPWASCAR